MPIRFQCPQCHSPKSVADEHAGKTGKCKCGATFKIPSPVEEESEAILDLSAHSQSESQDPFSFDVFSAEGASKESSNRNRKSPQSSGKKEIGKETKVEVDTSQSALRGGEFGLMFSALLISFYAVANNMFALTIIGFVLLVFMALVAFHSIFKDRFGITDKVEDKGILEKSNQVAVIVQHDKRAGLKKAFAFSLWLLIFLTVPFFSLVALFSLLGDSKLIKEPVAKVEPPPSSPPEETLDEKMKRERLELEARKEEHKLTPEEMLALVEQHTKELLAPEKIESRRVIAKEPAAQIVQWADCSDDLATEKYVELYASLFGDLQNLPPASPSLRYVLFEDKLFDLETKKYRTFVGRRHHLTSEKRGFNQRPLEISEDGTLLLVQAQSEDPQGSFQNMILLHKMDNSLVRAFPSGIEAHFLPGNKILLKDEVEGYTVVSGASFEERTPFVKRDLLAVSPNRKYIAFGGGKRIILEEEREGTDGQVIQTPFDLTIYSSDSFTPITDATYENFGYFRQAFFSNDGKKLLVANRKRCSAISLADGSVSGPVHQLVKDEICLGWVGSGSNTVAVMIQYRNGNFPNIRYFDVVTGNRLLRSDDNSDLSSIASFRGKFIYDPRNPEKWFPMPIAKLEDIVKSYAIGELKPIPRKVKLNIKTSWDQHDGLLVLMKQVAEKQLGLEVIDDQENAEHFILTGMIRSKEQKKLEVELKAIHPDQSLIWSAKGVSDQTVFLSEDPYQQQRVAESCLPAIVSAMNNLMLNHRLPRNYRQGFVPQMDEGNVKQEIPIQPSRQNLSPFAAEGTTDIDNRWLVENNFFDRPPVPVLDFEVPASSRIGSDAALKLIGFVENDSEAKVLMSYPGVGVFSLDLTATSKATAVEGLGEFSEATLNSKGKEILLMKEDSITFKALSSSKRGRSLKMESKPIAMAVNPSGTVLAVATDSKLQFFDLEMFASKPSSPDCKLCETEFEVGAGEIRFSANGKWFCAIGSAVTEESVSSASRRRTSGSTGKRRAIVVDVESKNATGFDVDADVNKAFIDNAGVFSCKVANGRLFTWIKSTSSDVATPQISNIKELLVTSVDGALSPSGDRYISIAAPGKIFAFPFPEGKPVEIQYDPGYSSEDKLKNGRLDWSASGGYYYLLEKDRIVVWKSRSVVGS